METMTSRTVRLTLLSLLFCPDLHTPQIIKLTNPAILGDLTDTLGKTIGGVTSTVGSVVTGLGKTAGDATEGLGHTISGTTEGLGNTTKDVGQTASTAVSNVSGRERKVDQTENPLGLRALNEERRKD